MNTTMIPWPNKGKSEGLIQGPKEQPAAGKDQPADTKPKPAVRPILATPEAGKPAPAALDLGCL